MKLKFQSALIHSFVGWVLLAGCSFRPSISLSPSFHPRAPIIIIPGIMGSELVNSTNGKVVWGKIVDLSYQDPHQALLNPDEDGIELPLTEDPEDGLIPVSVLSQYEMVNRLAEINAYADLIHTFSQCGLETGNLNRCRARDNVYLFAYDWRQDLVKTARQLAERITAIQKAVGNPDQKVTLIAHSMGGLIARYYLLYGDRDVLSDSLPAPDYSGMKNVDRVYNLGVPFGGSPMAFKSLQEGEWLGPFVTVSKWATFTMPSIYEMLPLDTTALFVDESGAPVSLNYFNAREWEARGFSIFNAGDWEHFASECSLVAPGEGAALAHRRRMDFILFMQARLTRGRRFQKALDVPWPRNGSPENFVIAGNCRPTLSRIVLRKTDPAAVTVQIVKRRGWYEHYYRSQPGDGTVLLSSATAPAIDENKQFTGCFQHRTMVSSRKVRKFLVESLADY